MKKQKSSKKKLARQLARDRNGRPKNREPRVPLEALSNEAVVKLRRRVARLGRTPTHAEARQIASEVRRSVARKYRLNPAWDEYRHLDACMREKADRLSGSYDPARADQYLI